MLKRLELTHFRNHDHLQVEFDELTIISGQNAAGKTNILEGIYLLGTGESFRATRIDEMVTWNQEVGHVVGKLANSQEPNSQVDELRVTVTRGVVQGKRVPKRLFRVNGAGKHRADFAGLLPVVLFRPEDLELLTGEPSGRRRFLNEVLSQVDREYARSLESYEKALKRRNKLLDLLREGQVSRTAFAFWDQILIKDGTFLTQRRTDFIEALNQVPSTINRLHINYDVSRISPERLRQYETEEVAVGYTMVGPHKDDFQVVELNDPPSPKATEGHGGAMRDLAIYGSRGEQRLTVLWLKEAQLTYMEQRLHSKPVLLLDDILSELDKKNSRRIAELCRKQQTIVTTTEEDTAELLGGGMVIQLGVAARGDAATR